MSKLQTKPWRAGLLILTLASLTACAGREPPKTVSDGCLIFKLLSFAQLPAGATDDPGNKADTSETVAQISEHNTRYEAICPRG